MKAIQETKLNIEKSIIVYLVSWKNWPSQSFNKLIALLKDPSTDQSVNKEYQIWSQLAQVMQWIYQSDSFSKQETKSLINLSRQPLEQFCGQPVNLKNLFLSGE